MRTVKVIVTFIVEVPESRKRDKALGAMAMEAEAVRIVDAALDGSDLDGSQGLQIGVLSWTSDAILEDL